MPYSVVSYGDKQILTGSAAFTADHCFVISLFYRIITMCQLVAYIDKTGQYTRVEDVNKQPNSILLGEYVS